MLQRRRVERFENCFGDRRLVQRTRLRIARRPGRHFLEVREVDDLPFRGDPLASRRDQVAGEHGTGQGELAHADALLYRTTVSVTPGYATSRQSGKRSGRVRPARRAETTRRLHRVVGWFSR